MPNAPLNLSDQARRTTEQPISYFMTAAIETPGLISLAAGLVDEPSLPVEEMRSAFADLFAADRPARARYNTAPRRAICPFGNGSWPSSRRMTACRLIH